MAQINQTNATPVSVYSSQSLAFNTSITSGSCLICYVFSDHTSGTLTVSDNINGTWPTVRERLADSTLAFACYVIENSGSGTITVTVNSGASDVHAFEIVEVIGVTSSCFQGVNGATQSGTPGIDNISSGNITLSTTPSILIGATYSNQGSSMPPAAGTGQTQYTYFWNRSFSGFDIASCTASLSYQHLTTGTTAAAIFSAQATDTVYTIGIVLTESNPPVVNTFSSAYTYSNSGSSPLLGELGPAGSLGIAVWTCDTTGNTVTPPAGWTQLYHGQINYDGADYYVWYNKNLTGSGSNNWTVVCGAENIFIIAAYSPIDQTTPIQDSHENVNSSGTSSPANITGLSVTSINANSLIVWIGIGDPDGGNGFAFTPPSGYTARVGTCGNQWTMLALADQVLSVAGSTGNEIGVFTRSGHSMGTNGIQIAFNPVQLTAYIVTYFHYV